MEGEMEVESLRIHHSIVYRLDVCEWTIDQEARAQKKKTFPKILKKDTPSLDRESRSKRRKEKRRAGGRQ